MSAPRRLSLPVYHPLTKVAAALQNTPPFCVDKLAGPSNLTILPEVKSVEASTSSPSCNPHRSKDSLGMLHSAPSVVSTTTASVAPDQYLRTAALRNAMPSPRSSKKALRLVCPDPEKCDLSSSAASNLSREPLSSSSNANSIALSGRVR